MVWGAIAGTAIPAVVGALSSSNAASDAADAAANVQMEQFNATTNNLSPYLTAGNNALNTYQSMLGLPSYKTKQRDPLSFEKWRKKKWDGSSIGGTQPVMIGGKEYQIPTDRFPADENALDAAQAGYNNYLNNFQYTKQVRQKPKGNKGDVIDPPQAALPVFDFDLENDEIYKFAADEAYQAGARKANAAGGAVSGGALNALAAQAAGHASKYQNDAFNRQMADYGADTTRANTYYGRNQDYLNRIAGLVGGGQNAAAQQGAFGQNYANQMGSIGMQDAASTANMWQGLNNAAQGTVGNYLYYDYLQNNPSPYAYPRPTPTITSGGGYSLGGYIDPYFDLGGAY